SRRSGPGSPIKDMRQQRIMSRRSGPGSPIKDMRQQRIMSRRSGPGSPIKDMRHVALASLWKTGVQPRIESAAGLFREMP
ncbi:MAG: hypothetical protein ABSG76_02755, partial [Xanthobacteraceae bacterium]